MSVKIHPQAIVEPSAQLGVDEVGPFCYIGGGVEIGDHTRVLHHASVEGKGYSWHGEHYFSICFNWWSYP